MIGGGVGVGVGDATGVGVTPGVADGSGDSPGDGDWLGVDEAAEDGLGTSDGVGKGCTCPFACGVFVSAIAATIVIASEAPTARSRGIGTVICNESRRCPGLPMAI